jgi:hypothetical protein
MTLILTATVSKPGALRYLARRAGQTPPASAQALISAVAANDLAAANFTGSAVMPTGGVPMTAEACIVEGDTMVLWVVAQDEEGSFPGRWPNNSTMSRCAGALAAACGSVLIALGSACKQVQR